MRFGRERLGIGTLHAGAQVLQGAELQLLHRALAASQALSRFHGYFSPRRSAFRSRGVDLAEAGPPGETGARSHRLPPAWAALQVGKIGKIVLSGDFSVPSVLSGRQSCWRQSAAASRRRARPAIRNSEYWPALCGTHPRSDPGPHRDRRRASRCSRTPGRNSVRTVRQTGWGLFWRLRPADGRLPGQAGRFPRGFFAAGRLTAIVPLTI